MNSLFSLFFIWSRWLVSVTLYHSLDQKIKISYSVVLELFFYLNLKEKVSLTWICDCVLYAVNNRAKHVEKWRSFLVLWLIFCSIFQTVILVLVCTLMWSKVAMKTNPQKFIIIYFILIILHEIRLMTNVCRSNPGTLKFLIMLSSTGTGNSALLRLRHLIENLVENVAAKHVQKWRCIILRITFTDEGAQLGW